MRGYGARNDALLQIRLPSTMKADLMQRAALNYRRVNAEVLLRLQESLEKETVNEHGVIVADLTRGGK